MIDNVAVGNEAPADSAPILLPGTHERDPVGQVRRGGNLCRFGQRPCPAGRDTALELLDPVHRVTPSWVGTVVGTVPASSDGSQRVWIMVLTCENELAGTRRDSG